MEQFQPDLGYHHNLTNDQIYTCYRNKESEGEGWHFNEADIDMPIRHDLSDHKFSVYYREDDEAFIVVRNRWAIEIHPEEIPPAKSAT